MKTKNIRRTLVMSILALTLCIAMMAGSTFAWFTDSVVSGNNIIKSGNLDVVLEYKTAWSDAWTTVDETTEIFDDEALYEPGYTEVVFLRVANAGSLALKYDMAANIVSEKTSTNVYGNEFKLSDYLHMGAYVMDEYSSGFNYADILMPTMFDTREKAVANIPSMKPISEKADLDTATRPLLPGDKTAQVMALVLHMPETVGNEANHLSSVAAPEIHLGISVVATQYTYEEDAFDDQYDKDAEYPAAEVNNASDLINALAEGKDAKLTGDVDLTASASNGNFEIPASAGEVTLDLNGYTLTAPAREGYTGRTQYALDNYADLTITGNGTVISRGVQNYGKLTVEEGVTLVASDTNGGAAIYAYTGSETTVNGATLTAENNAACIIAYGKLTVNGGTYTQTGTGKTYAVLAYADAVINNANVTGVHGAVCGDTNLTINGGNYVTTGVVGQSDHVVYGSANSAIVITDGTFNGEYDAGGKSIWVGGTASITGGVFGTDPSAYVADGYNAALNAEGKWVVSAN